MGKEVTSIEELAADEWNGFSFETFSDDGLIEEMDQIFAGDLSEPYSVYTYRYFLHQWPELTLLAYDSEHTLVGAIVSKLDIHPSSKKARGYIGMLAVVPSCRGKGLGSFLVQKSVWSMMQKGCQEVSLETEVTNQASLQLYKKLGFMRDKRLPHYYLNGNDAFRLKLPISEVQCALALQIHDQS